MSRIRELDLPDRLAPTVPRWLTMAGTGVLSAGLCVLVRTVFDVLAPGSAPFALIFPVTALATLLARWQAGAVSAVISTLYLWYFIYPVRNSFRFETTGAALTVVVIALSCAMLLAIAELFRRAVHRATGERDREIAARDLFLAEFDHRVKNNFAMVASVIELQRRRSPDPATQAALAGVLARVESIARAHRHLYRGSGMSDAVDMADYLKDLSGALADALFLHGAIRLTCEAEPVAMPRDRAVSIGLVLNELVTNAAKHAFAGRDHGTIAVTFGAAPTGGWVLTVRDDGIGIDPDRPAPIAGSGLGRRLLDAFADKADGTMTIATGATGTRATLDLRG